MQLNNEWKDFEVVATGDGEKLERWGNYLLIRPDPQVIWRAKSPLRNYPDISAIYQRSSTGGGHWEFIKPVPDDFVVGWRKLKFKLKLMGFKHTGLFPEQAVNWARMIDLIENASRPISVLNLFAYTGGATLACLSAGASVTHVDSAKAMVERARSNAELSGLKNAPCRYIIDDCLKFVEREIKRKKTYDAVIMDPPSYGRGPSGELWKIEENIYDLVEATSKLLTDSPLFYLVNSYTTGLQPTVMANILSRAISLRGVIEADEIGLPTSEGISLPAGCSAFLVFK
ncbi:MAG TPA: class I SAM-dependent methyltransferase [Eubacteriales bacterium]|jgi:23S rRNA (cytosine1962-C5)-methyltransferase|nr:class I SAM-dependent methyltransferase [Clostridia bacterium]HRR90066.1 class I SAM-dependent methyltransferase [Eubacteriales bacterium]HRU84229.1 class I SAM-dependent methyltransferase [Eubacteriales bacterium]